MKEGNLVGKRVREARLAAKPPVTQEDLVARLQIQGLDLNQTMISKIERGQRSVSDYELLALAKALKVKAAWLLEGDESEATR
ncbi:helix-turn-helix domain-containing protein [Dehalogenimonas formicexedens]|uniref:helix-turn-helix domain-containing protein n=1 Tax=Dehalogenimonas formicexedens TaxID=1839801 RepID=UPI00096BA3BF|nr:helix-turn-helix transcriptional regulator [Dehalogenimonas formicexedens]